MSLEDAEDVTEIGADFNLNIVNCSACEQFVQVLAVSSSDGVLTSNWQEPRNGDQVDANDSQTVGIESEEFNAGSIVCDSSGTMTCALAFGVTSDNFFVPDSLQPRIIIIGVVDANSTYYVAAGSNGTEVFQQPDAPNTDLCNDTSGLTPLLRLVVNNCSGQTICLGTQTTMPGVNTFDITPTPILLENCGQVTVYLNNQLLIYDDSCANIISSAPYTPSQSGENVYIVASQTSGQVDISTEISDCGSSACVTTPFADTAGQSGNFVTVSANNCTSQDLTLTRSDTGAMCDFPASDVLTLQMPTGSMITLTDSMGNAFGTPFTVGPNTSTIFFLSDGTTNTTAGSCTEAMVDDEGDNNRRRFIGIIIAVIIGLILIIIIIIIIRRSRGGKEEEQKDEE